MANEDLSLDDLVRLYSTTSTSSGGESWSGDPKLLRALLQHKLNNDLTNIANGGPIRPAMSRIRMRWIK